MSVARESSLPVTVHLLTMDLSALDSRFLPITEKHRAVLEEIMREYNPAHSVHLLDVTEDYLRKLYGGKNVKNHYTPYAQGRLLLSGLDLPDKVLYLDADVMCCGDIRTLFEIDIENYEFAAALDEMGKRWIRHDYCNSGVMLMNLKRMRETALLERACTLLQRKRFCFPDQSALNRLVREKLILPRRFNEQRGLREDTVFKHFCRGVRLFPFKVYNIKQSQVGKVQGFLRIRRFDELYEKYASLASSHHLTPLEG